MSYVVNHSADRNRQRLVSTWIDRQTHDEFEILAKSRGTTKAALWRQLIENEVQFALRSTSPENRNATQNQKAT